jgi:hypothetical protein
VIPFDSTHLTGKESRPEGRIPVLTYRILLHQRFEPPAMHVVDACDVTMARAIAADLYEGSRRHVGVEVWYGERRVFIRGAVPDPRFSPGHGCCARLAARRLRYQ